MKSSVPPEAKKLHICSVQHLANQLSFAPDKLVDIADRTDNLYHDFRRNVKGKERDLTMAVPPLSILQRRILDRILCRLPVSARVRCY